MAKVGMAKVGMAKVGMGEIIYSSIFPIGISWWLQGGNKSC